VANRNRIDRHLGPHGHVYRNVAHAYDECFYYPNNSDAYEGGIRRVANGDSNTDVIDKGSDGSTVFGVLSAKTGGTGLAANTRAGMKSNRMDVLKLGDCDLEYLVRLQVPTAPTAGEDFSVVSGIADDANSGTTSTGNQTPQGIYIKWGINSTNTIVGTCRDGSGQTFRTLYSGQNPGTTWHTYGFKYTSASGGSVQFYLDGARMGTSITTNIPTVALGFLPVLIKKHFGTTNRNAEIDFYSYKITYNTSR